MPRAQFGLTKEQMSDMASPHTPSRLSNLTGANGRMIRVEKTPEGNARVYASPKGSSVYNSNLEVPLGDTPVTEYGFGSSSAGLAHAKMIRSAKPTPSTEERISQARTVTDDSGLSPDISITGTPEQKIGSYVDPTQRALEEIAGIVPRRKRLY